MARGEVAMTKVPRVGDRVIVPFGGYEKEAEVIRIVDIFTPPKVEVEFKLQPDDDFMVYNLYSIERIRPASAPVS
jgi:hypothetical protein